MADRAGRHPVVLHEMRSDRGTEAHKTDGLAELVCSNCFLSDDAATNAVGLLHEEMRRAGSLIMRPRRPQAARRRRAGRRPRSLLRARHARARRHPLVTIDRGEIAGLPPADGTTSSSPRGRSRRRRCPRPSSSLPAKPSSPSSMPSRPSCIWSPSTRASPGASRATTNPVRAAPAPTTSTAPCSHPRVRSVSGCVACRRQDLVQGLGSLHPLFRRLPAHRGDGRARPRDAALRADETGGPHQSASRHEGPMPSSSCGRTMRSARCGTWSASRPN